MTKPIPWTALQILEATKGELLCGGPERFFSGISIDSRRIFSGDLFVAIQGEVHDGHSFVKDVVESGVCGLLINKNKADVFFSDVRVREDWRQKGLLCVAVKDTTKALGDLTAFQRRRSNVSVIAITGSNGKTTTKEMTNGIVSRCFGTLATIGNFNNQIGLPLTLLKLNRSHQWSVLELGMNHPGEIRRLSEICMPDIGVITNIGPAHLEKLGSLKGVMDAKAELLENIKPNGTVVLNADDPNLSDLCRRTSKKILRFGFSEDADIRAISVKKKRFGTSFILSMPTETLPIDLKIPGAFMISNALAAASAGYLLGLKAEDIKAGLEEFKSVQGRMNVFKTKNGIHIIDDTYNANPGSMESAIMTLKSMKGEHRGVLVAGDMHELGEHAEFMHKKIGSVAAGIGISGLYLTGRFAGSVAAGAQRNGMKRRDIFTGTKQEIVENLKDTLGPDDWVLVKGSRAMAMEQVVQDLRDWADI
jgi:UDP-N-acetylmuramoyl-tripeptide--D-alanyl-D-alanine ligase